mmetsp:Transcript_49246/g.152130  ORF Transcript_49246/g.152130 Transcript_49246/m.152130 type:complete len:238 (+) Transcript_49246:321-1034(+)
MPGSFQPNQRRPPTRTLPTSSVTTSHWSCASRCMMAAYEITASKKSSGSQLRKRPSVSQKWPKECSRAHCTLSATLSMPRPSMPKSCVAHESLCPQPVPQSSTAAPGASHSRSMMTMRMHLWNMARSCFHSAAAVSQPSPGWCGLWAERCSYFPCEAATRRSASAGRPARAVLSARNLARASSLGHSTEAAPVERWPRRLGGEPTTAKPGERLLATRRCMPPCHCARRRLRQRMTSW